MAEAQGEWLNLEKEGFGEYVIPMPFYELFKLFLRRPEAFE
jgi:hypothetical protein